MSAFLRDDYVTVEAIGADLSNVLVVGYSEVDSVMIEIEDTSLKISSEGIVVNQGEHPMIFGDTLKTELEVMTRRIYGIISALNSANRVGENKSSFLLPDSLGGSAGAPPCREGTPRPVYFVAI